MEKLKSLFQKGRRLWVREKEKEAREVFQEACELSRAKGLETESRFFEAIIANVDGKVEKATQEYLKLAEEEAFSLKGNAFFLAGWAYYEKKEYDKAIECYEKALKEKSYDTPGDAWNNMGITYGKKKEYDKAIECYEKALKEKSYDTPGKAWNNMGNAYYEKKEYDKAIECYEKALKEKSYDTPGNAWNNMGNAYKEKKEYDKAIKCFEKAISWAKHAQSPSTLERAELLLSLTKKDKHGGAESETRKEIRAFVQRERPAPKEVEDRVPSESTIIENEIAKIHDKFDTVAADYSGKPGSGLDDVFVFLKGWSSSIPGFSYTYPERFSNTECLGGGYFLKWNGKGIVIDPGTHFLKNFASVNSMQPCLFEDGRFQNFHIREIDVVVTTHNHPDHTYDLPMLADLIGQYNQQVERKKTQGYPFSIGRRFLQRSQRQIGRLLLRGEHSLDPSS